MIDKKPPWHTIPGDNFRRARELRDGMTVAERVLWKRLRYENLGPKFRRQHPIGQFIVDFYSRECNLVIELDGGVHQETEIHERDEAREEYLKSLGLCVKRYKNTDVLDHLNDVVADIRASMTPLLSPRKQGDPRV